MVVSDVLCSDNSNHLSAYFCDLLYDFTTYFYDKMTV